MPDTAQQAGTSVSRAASARHRGCRQGGKHPRPGTSPAGRRTLPCILVAAMMAAAAATAGCGTRVAAANAQGPEKRDLVVAAVPGEGAAGLYIAEEQGLFARAGLHVRIETVTNSSTVIPAMLHGSIDVAAGQYTSYIEADATGVAQLRILAAGYSLGARVQEIMVGPHSKIMTIAGLKGATIAVNAVDSETTDLLYSVLAAYGITPDHVHVTAVPFPQMAATLAEGRVDAIYAVEPYVTEAAEQHGDVDLADLDSGPNQGFPIAGYGALASWAEKYPHTAAAFIRAIEQGNEIAASSPASLQHALITALHLGPDVADLMATGTFPTDTRVAQLQRVADLMLRYGQLSHPFSVRSITGP